MTEAFKAVKVTDSVHWVGAIDWNVRDFHGYEIGHGTTYNAYLVLGDRVTLIDTVKRPFLGEMTARIESVIGDLSKIDFIISNHSEMDHSGALPATVALARPDKVFASKMGRKALAAHFGDALEIEAVEDGATLDLGGAKFTFRETRMLHWPDSMVTYYANDRVLFSQDGFGMHVASSERFDDELPEWLLEGEARRYFANILLPFSPVVRKVLEMVSGMGVEIDVVAPDHGPIWRSKIGWIIALYGEWAAQKPSNKAVVAYDTMWESTHKMARAIGEGLSEGGVQARVRRMGPSHRSDVATDILECGALIVGSPTINNQMFPTVADMLTYVRGLKPQNLIGAAFGSYGWSGEAPDHVAEILGAMGVELVGEPLKVQYVPREADLGRCREMGLEIARRLAKITA